MVLVGRFIGLISTAAYLMSNLGGNWIAVLLKGLGNNLSFERRLFVSRYYRHYFNQPESEIKVCPEKVQIALFDKDQKGTSLSAVLPHWLDSTAGCLSFSRHF